MKIGIAADHAGFEQKQKLIKQLQGVGYELKDYGAYQIDPEDDYPDVVLPLAHAIANGEVERGIAICGSGVGVSIAANKVAGVRAALVTENYSAHQGVEHDHMNLLCLGGRVIGPLLLQELVETFLKARFTGEDRFQRRLNKVLAMEKGCTEPKSKHNDPAG